MNYNKSQYIQLYGCANKELYFITIEKKSLNYNIQPYELQNKSMTNCLEMKDNNFIVIGLNGSSYYFDLLKNDSKPKENKITNKTYRGICKISENIVGLSSNEILPNGENSFIFYNINKKNISYKIEEYSYTISVNNLALIPREEVKSDKKILLCACKKYKSGQNNGILLVNPQLGNNKRINNEFYDTGNYEVYCICPLLNVENSNDDYNDINEKYRKNINITDTNYFLTGGFDDDKREGIIKLFKVIFKEKAWETEIEFMQDIVIEDEKFEYFDGPISCILQSKINGNILVSCNNGTVHLFTPPNLEYYLQDELD